MILANTVTESLAKVKTFFALKEYSMLFIHVSYLCLPPTGSGDILFFPVRLSVRPSVRHKSCPLYNLKTVKDFSMKLGTLVDQDETICHAQEP